MLFCKRHLRSKNLSQAFSFILSCLRNRKIKEKKKEGRNRKIGFHRKAVTPGLRKRGSAGARPRGWRLGLGSCWALQSRPKTEAQDSGMEWGLGKPGKGYPSTVAAA